MKKPISSKKIVHDFADLLCSTTQCSNLFNSSRYSESFEFLPTTFAITLLTLALLIVLKVEFNFEVILHTVHYHFCILNSRKLEQNSLESAPIIMFLRRLKGGKILTQRGLIFSFCHLITQLALIFKNIAQQLPQCLHDAPCLPLFLKL